MSIRDWARIGEILQRLDALEQDVNLNKLFAELSRVLTRLEALEGQVGKLRETINEQMVIVSRAIPPPRRPPGRPRKDANGPGPTPTGD